MISGLFYIETLYKALVIGIINKMEIRSTNEPLFNIRMAVIYDLSLPITGVDYWKCFHVIAPAS